MDLESSDGFGFFAIWCDSGLAIFYESAVHYPLADWWSPIAGRTAISFNQPP